MLQKRNFEKVSIGEEHTAPVDKLKVRKIDACMKLSEANITEEKKTQQLRASSELMTSKILPNFDIRNIETILDSTLQIELHNDTLSELIRVKLEQFFTQLSSYFKEEFKISAEALELVYFIGTQASRGSQIYLCESNSKLIQITKNE